MPLNVTPSGLSVSSQYLSVGLIVKGPTWTQFALVKIPLRDLLATELGDQLVHLQLVDLEARRAVWDEQRSLDLFDSDAVSERGGI